MEKLQRQRALVQEHLRWLDSEIANEASVLPHAEPVSPVPVAPTPAPAMSPIAGSDAFEQPEIPEADVQGLHNEVRSGCMLYFGIAAALLGAVIAFIYWRY